MHLSVASPLLGGRTDSGQNWIFLILACKIPLPWAKMVDRMLHPRCQIFIVLNYHRAKIYSINICDKNLIFNERGTFSVHFWLERRSLVSHWWWDKVALAKSVNNLLLAANASKARLIVVTWYFMIAFGLIYVRFRANLQFSIGMAQGRAIIRVGLK